VGRGCPCHRTGDQYIHAQGEQLCSQPGRGGIGFEWVCRRVFATAQAGINTARPQHASLPAVQLAFTWDRTRHTIGPDAVTRWHAACCVGRRASYRATHHMVHWPPRVRACVHAHGAHPMPDKPPCPPNRFRWFLYIGSLPTQAFKSRGVRSYPSDCCSHTSSAEGFRITDSLLQRDATRWLTMRVNGWEMAGHLRLRGLRMLHVL